MIGILVTADPSLTQPKTTGIVLGLAIWRYMALAIQNRQKLFWGFAAFGLLGSGIVAIGVLSTNWSLKVGFLEQVIPLIPSRLIELPETPAEGVHANSLAGVLTLFVPLSLTLLTTWRPNHFKTAVFFIFLLLFSLTFGLLLLTQSRSGWMGTAAGFMGLTLLWSFFIPSPKIRWLISFGFGCIVLLAMLALIWAGPAKVQTLLEAPRQQEMIGDFSTFGFRLEVWQWALAGIKNFPFTGTGLGAFRQVVQRLYPINVHPDYDIAHAHNIFLQTALDIGLPGLIAYLAILGIAGGVGWQVAKQDERLRPFALGLLASLIAFHTYGLTDALALGSKPGILFWMVLGLLTAMSNKQVKGNNNQ